MDADDRRCEILAGDGGGDDAVDAVIDELYEQLRPLIGPDDGRSEWWLELHAALLRQERSQRSQAT